MGFITFLSVVMVSLLVFMPVVGDIAVLYAAIAIIMFLIGLFALSEFGKKRNAAEEYEDELDKLVIKRANIAGLIASFGMIVLACIIMISFFQYQGKAAIPIKSLNQIFAVGGFVLLTVREVAILVQYGRGKRHVLN